MSRKTTSKRAGFLSVVKKGAVGSIKIGGFLLGELLDSMDWTPMHMDTPYNRVRAEYEGRKAIRAHRLRQEIVRLKKRGWVVEARKNGKRFLKLTEQGRLEALYRRLEDVAKAGKKWDGKWRMIMFDIPERGRRERYAIRAILRSTGFFQMQKSIYVYPYQIPNELIEYLKTAELLPYIRFARVDQLDEPRALKKQFKLH